MRAVAITWLKLILALAFIAICFDWRPSGTAEHHFLWRQDLPVAAGITLALFAATMLQVSKPSLERWASGRAVLVAALLVLTAGGLGAGVVFEHYTLSMDEFMADFDAAIFRHGILVAPVAPEWRPYVPALQPIFMLEVPDHRFWASAYLPINALMRAGADAVGLREWLNPLLSAVAVAATLGVGRQLWPEHPRRGVAAALLLATSAQLMMTAMSGYAMAGHLALNMVWLWLFLRDRRFSDAAALAVGFAAAGLHQVAFHPLFVGFFILELFLAKRWGRAALYTAGYALICLFWVAYWGVMFRALGVSPEEGAGVGGITERALELLRQVSPANIGLMADNLVRYVSWQNPLVPALALIGGAAALKMKGPLRAMTLAILVNALFMLILMPTQTHGWGYRYQHGLLGVAALLAVQGLVVLTAPLADAERRKAVQAAALIGLAGAAILIPVRAWQAHGFNHPYARSYTAILAAKSDIVILDSGTVGFDVGTFIRNDPMLQKPPKILVLGALTPEHLDDLCSRGRVFVFDANNPAAKGILTFEAPWAPRNAALRAHLRERGCGG